MHVACVQHARKYVCMHARMLAFMQTDLHACNTTYVCMQYICMHAILHLHVCIKSACMQYYICMHAINLHACNTTSACMQYYISKHALYLHACNRSACMQYYSYRTSNATLTIKMDSHNLILVSIGCK